LHGLKPYRSVEYYQIKIGYKWQLPKAVFIRLSFFVAA